MSEENEKQRAAAKWWEKSWGLRLRDLFWDKGCLEAGELLDRLEEIGFSEGQWDGILEAVEERPGVVVDEDNRFYWRPAESGTCGGCAWWDREIAPARDSVQRLCMNQRFVNWEYSCGMGDPGKSMTAANCAGAFFTGPDFGCVHFESQGAQ